MPAKPVSCAICDELRIEQLVELDAILGDPRRWPSTIWDQFQPPAGILPPKMRRWGAVKMGMRWLEDHRPDISLRMLLRHYNTHVTFRGSDPAELIAAGVLEKGLAPKPSEIPIDPLAFMKLYGKAIALGIRGIELLEQKLADYE